MSLLGVVVRTELRQHLRDPVTLILMVGVPLFAYPALGAAGHRLAESSAVEAEAEVFDVATEPEFPLPANLRRVEVPDLEAAVTAGTVLAAARRTPEGADVVWDSREPDSHTARTRLRDALRDWRRSLAARPLELDDRTTPERALRLKASTWLPLMLLFTILTTGLYTALDVVTGEKERGTLETVLTTAVDRRVVLLGKALVVLVFTLAGALLSAVSAYVGARWGAGLDLSIGELASVVALFLPICLLLTAALTAAAAWASDFKSGQVLTTPVLVVPLALAGAAFVPGLALTPLSALVPVTGSALAARDVVAGGANPWWVALSVVAALGWSAASLVGAARLLGREEVLLGASGARQRRLGGDYRADALGVLAIGLLALWFLGQTAQSVNLLAGMVFTQVGLFVPLALVAPWWLGLPVRSTLRLHGAAPREWLRAVVVGLTLPGLALCVSAAQGAFLTAPKALFADLFPADLPLWQLILVFGVLPGACEELLFRGAFFGLWRTRSPAWVTVGVTAVVFGAFHLSVFRFFPTAVLGLALGTVSVRSRSVLPGMVAHTLNNSVAMVFVSRQWSIDFGWPAVVAAGVALAALAPWPATLGGSATSQARRPEL